MDICLFVVKPFGGMVRGDIISDPVRVAQILNSEWAHSVVRVLVAPMEGS